MLKIKGVTVVMLAKEFCKVLRETLTAQQLVIVIQRNKKEPCDAISHTHDFCDANMVMVQAGKQLGLKDLSERVVAECQTAEGGKYLDLWNEAWSLAEYNHSFNPDDIDAVYADVQSKGY